MRHFALICLAVSGCFYADPINQRPSLDIQQTDSNPVYRGSMVTLKGIANDPEDDFVSFQWRGYACTDQTYCDEAPFYTGILETARFTVPSQRVVDVDGDGMLDPVPVEAVLVLLEGKDDYGATARPIQQLVIPVGDHPPDLELRKDSRHGYVVGTEINIYAKVGDVDDGPNNPVLSWQVYSPTSNPPYMIEDTTVEPDGDPTHVQYGKKFKPEGEGEWIVEVTATDSLLVATTKTVMMIVGPDMPPCLAQLSPLVATNPALPISEATWFQVTVVKDDLNPFPTVPDDPVLGPASFTWSLTLPNTTTRIPLTGITSNRVALDPANYAPGDVLELRVEVQDRISRSLTGCGDAATCSLTSDTTCLQRQTWRVEVR